MVITSLHLIHLLHRERLGAQLWVWTLSVAHQAPLWSVPSTGAHGLGLGLGSSDRPTSCSVSWADPGGPVARSWGPTTVSSAYLTTQVLLEAAIGETRPRRGSWQAPQSERGRLPLAPMFPAWQAHLLCRSCPANSLGVRFGRWRKPSEPGIHTTSNASTGCTDLSVEKELDCEKKAEILHLVLLCSAHLLLSVCF